jgi:hypothetical protein
MKRPLPSLELESAAYGWETDLRLDNTPVRGGALRGLRGAADVPADAPDAPPAESPGAALLRMRLATPKAKVGALKPLGSTHSPRTRRATQPQPALEPRAPAPPAASSLPPAPRNHALRARGGARQ